MKGVYYSQRYDSRWKDIPYTNGGTPGATIATSGCGPTSAAMVLTSVLGRSIFPDEVADFALKNGHRQEGVGTKYSLFPDLANEYHIECFLTGSIDSLLRHLKTGGMAIVGCPSSSTGLFSDSGHIIAITGYDEFTKKIIVHDPYLYPTKYTKGWRAPLVKYKAPSGSTGTLTNGDCLTGFDILVDPSVITEQTREAYYCYSRGIDSNRMKPYKAKVIATTLNVRSGAGTKYCVVGKKKQSEIVIVYETVDEWARIGEMQWCSTQYLARVYTAKERDVRVDANGSITDDWVMR